MKKDLINWVTLHKISSISIMKIGYFGIVLVPLLSFFINDLVIYFPSIKLSSHLAWLYLGSILLTLGNILSEVLCPYIIREYRDLASYRKNLSDYIEYNKVISNYNTEMLAKRLESALTNQFDVSGENLATTTEILKLAIGNVTRDAHLSKSEIIDNETTKYETTWIKESKSLYSIQVIIFICFFVSALIAIGSLGVTSLNVLKATL